MVNLRLNRIKTTNSTTIKAQFTHELYPYLTTENISVTSNTAGINDPVVLFIKIIKDVLIITLRPMTPLAAYFVEFKSTETVQFKSKNGDAFLFEDGKTNISLIYGPEDPADPIRDNLLGYLDGSVYNFDDNTLARSIINSQSVNLSKALHDIGQSKNDNYLEVTIEDERKIRGSGPYDRLNEEGAFEVIRVGKNKTNTSLSAGFSFDSFPSDPITLLRNDITSEELSVGTGVGNFNGLILTVENGPVTILKKVLVVYQDGYTAEYNIESLGYQIKDSRYDTSFSSTLITLENNQFKLNQSIFESDSEFIRPVSGDLVYVDYEYKYLGRFIDEASVVVSQVLDATREVIQPLFTQFSLQYAPIVNSNDTILDIDGVVFLDPLSNPPFFDTHPAFQNEIPFRLESLPSIAGQYSINYENGMVFVYGEETNNGTGYFPPVATYKYRNVFDSRLDYTYNAETNELVSSPLRELTKQEAKISFDYEQVLTPNVDFKAQTHVEILDERIENRLNNLGSLSVINTPITNVFRVFNETSGEIYTVNRFTDSAVFFSYSNPPRIFNVLRERPSFLDVLSETILVESETINSSNLRIFKIILENNNIMSSTEDVVGSSYNSSAGFSRSDIFQREIYFDSQVETLEDNLDRLLENLYAIDYRNGIIYVGVSDEANFDLGTINYKAPYVVPNNGHITSVSNIYNSISSIKGINKTINYVEFGDATVSPSSFDYSDERFLNLDTSLPYLLESDQIYVQDNIKDVRHIYDTYDLLNNDAPVNFGYESTVSSNIITISSTGIQLKYTTSVSGGSTVVLPFISLGVDVITVTSVLRTSDSQELWDGSGIISGYTLTLSGVGSPVNGDNVNVIYNVKLNSACTPIVDYNRGDYYIDYNYLADEILVSYEYGDNVVDFRESDSLNEGDEYFVTYKVGALRDALLKNFGTLVDIPILNTFDTSLSRELYRDALQAALQSFTKGPTLPSLNLLVSQITKIDPEIIESVFEVWSLGVSYLYQESIGYTGDLELLNGKFDNGVLVKNSDETITFPVSSNLRLEDGSLAMWVLPEWNGLDNDATLTFSSLIKDGYDISESSIYIGASSFHPEFDDDGNFSLNKTDDDSPIGLPSAIYTQTGVFIYYDDVAARWNILAKDTYTTAHTYSGTIISSGEVYDVKYIENLGELTDTLRSYTNKIEFIFKLDSSDQSSPDGYSTTDGYIAGHSFDGITFMADDLHYLFDFGKTEKTNRFSLYKDGRGYLNFEVWDKGNNKSKTSYKVSADISDWLAGEKHFIGCSWRINSKDRQDELHLFIDGVEVPNILRYGGRPIASSSDRFRIVAPEIVAGTIPKKTILGDDLHTVVGSNIVYSDSVNFQTEGILAGDTIEVLELNFDTYTILFVSSNFLTLNQNMPTTFGDARFSVNKYSVVVSSEIDLAPNITISILGGSDETEIPGLRANLPSYEISKNGANENVLTLLGNADAGDQIVVRTLGLNHRRYRERVYLWGDTTSVLKTQLPPPINLDEAKIYRVILPLTIIGPDNSTLVGPNFVSGPLSAGQPSNATEGRTLAVRMTGGNINFSITATVTINGTTAGGPTSEIISFTQAGTQNTVQMWETITSVVVQTRPIISSQNSAGVEIKEAYVITDPETNSIFPVIRFSYKTQSGTTLSGDGSGVVSDDNGLFVDSDVGSTITISSPGPVAGTYTISERIDEHSVSVTPTPAGSFTSGVYNVYNISIGRSGFQNGYFTLETAGQTDTPFLLNEGYYDFDYSAYLNIGFDPLSNIYAYVGSDLNGENQAKAIIDEFRILSKQITDVRIGETLATNDISFTTDYVALKEFEPDYNALMLLRFNEFPFVNEAPFYISATKEYVQSANSVNSNFSQSIVITDKPLVYENKGFLSTASEGTIEFWVSPRFDTYNDPNFRFYFDASAAIVEEVTSITNGTVKVSNSISEVISVRLATDTDNTGIDYFAVDGSISDDFKTIRLGLALPSQQTPVKISYIPSGLSGDRISIYKDSEGFLTFNVKSGDNDYQVRQPIFWQRDTWHRVKATYRFNSSDNHDEIRLFMDGEERGIILFGTGLIFGDQVIFAQSLAGLGTTQLTGDINFNDPINNFYIGSDYFGVNTANARMDNFKISNIIQSPTLIAGQYKDINYSSNTDTVYPVIEDAFTTFLFDFDQLVKKIDDFAILRDEAFGIFNFTLNVIDSFSIVEDSAKLQQILETLILTLKPAQSKVEINYIR